jgi:tryptophanyl-tRNA synthetase
MKKRLFTYYMDTFGGARARFEELQQDPGEVERVLSEGAAKVREKVAPLMDRVRSAVGVR